MNTITSANVDQESYYNACQLCRLTGYANAPAAIKELDLIVYVERDVYGNIGQARIRRDQ